jgi:hypothetical protein
MQIQNALLTGSTTVYGPITFVSGSIIGSSSYAATSSYADTFTVAGSLTAQTLVVQTITSSITYSSGSNIFGNSPSNTQTFTGSVNISGSISSIGTLLVSGSGITIATFRSYDIQSPQISIIGTDRSATIGLNARAVGIALAGIDINNNNNSQIIFRNVNSTVQYGTLGQTSATDFGLLSGTDLKLYASSSLTMYLSTGSLVGVGRNFSNPTATLHISGSGSGSLMQISSHVSSNIFFVSGSGNIGIGISSPAEKIHVFGSSGATSPRILIQSHDTANATAGLSLYGRDASNVNKVSEIVTSGADLTISVNSTERMRITGAGNVGIGTTSPSNKVDIFGAGSSTAGTLAVRGAGSGTFIVNRLVSRETSNGTSTIATVSSPGGNDRVFFKIQVINVSAVANYGNAHVGYALWEASTKSVTTMTLDTGNSNISNTNVGTLSWSGNNLQYTTNGAGNYENNHIIIYAVARDSATVS